MCKVLVTNFLPPIVGLNHHETRLAEYALGILHDLSDSPFPDIFQSTDIGGAPNQRYESGSMPHAHASLGIPGAPTLHGY